MDLFRAPLGCGRRHWQLQQFIAWQSCSSYLFAEFLLPSFIFGAVPSVEILTSFTCLHHRG